MDPDWLDPKRIRPFKIDLHIHTALSPCADPDMTPPRIIHAARAKGLRMIAVTDHNSAENAAAVMEAARGTGICVVPGMELQTQEEVHLICLFPVLDACLTWQAEVYEALPRRDNVPRIFGTQPVLDGQGQFIRELTRLLLVSANISVDQAARRVAELGGLCLPAHVDRPSYSLLAVLGLIPPGASFPAMELSRLVTGEEAAALFPPLAGYPLLSSSDAHSLTDVGTNVSTIWDDRPPDFDGLLKALGGQSGRKVMPQMKDLSMHIIDIIQNSLEAGAAEISLTIDEDLAGDQFTITISDNGRGMDPDTLARVTDPFFTTRNTRRVGLGIPLFKAAAERCEGRFELTSAPGQGTVLQAVFRHSHLDRAPLGNIIDSVVNLTAGSPDLNFSFIHRKGTGEVRFDAAELREQLEDIPLNNPAVLNWIKNYLLKAYEDMNQN